MCVVMMNNEAAAFFVQEQLLNDSSESSEEEVHNIRGPMIRRPRIEYVSNVVDQYSDEEFRQNFRLSRASFNQTLLLIQAAISSDITVVVRNTIPAKTQLLMAILSTQSKTAPNVLVVNWMKHLEMFAATRIACRIQPIMVQSRNMTVVSGPPTVKVSAAEKYAHGLAIVGGMLVVPAWVLVNIKNYRAR